MELTEVFRHKDGQVFPALHSAHDRYGKLRDIFLKFVGFFAAIEGDFPKGLEFKVDTELPQLTVCYCGTEYRFVFEMVKEHGQVRCLTLSIYADENTDPEEIGRFTFNGKGVTNIQPPGDDHDQIEIVDPGGAYYVVANFLLAPFK